VTVEAQTDSRLEADIAIVGGGLVGAALALALARLPLKVALLENQSLADQMRPAEPINGVADVDPRVSAITEASRRFLCDLGAWDRLPAGRVEAYRQMVVWDGEGTGEIVFHADDLQVPQLGHILENRLLVRALLEAIAGQERVEVLDRVQAKAWRQQGKGGTLQLEDGREIHAGLTVGADGARSRVRQWAGLPLREWDYQQQAIVCTVRTEHSHRHTAWQRFARTGPLAFLPLTTEAGDDRLVSIVWSQDNAEAEWLMQLDDSDFCQALERALESRLGSIQAVSGRHALPLRQRHAKTYTGGGVALVGDAAHTIHPLAGQGVNLGFADAAVLADEIRRGLARGLAPGDPAVLQRYERRRKGDNLAMMAGMEGFKQLFGRDELPLRWLRNTGLRWINRQGMLKQWLAAEAMGLHKDLPRFSRSA
jgi:2-octaprenylphenol hydroxylase